ncbi:MAG: FAD-dependent oxidoreductase [Verrucomicrobiota bacterium]
MQGLVKTKKSNNIIQANKKKSHRVRKINNKRAKRVVVIGNGMVSHRLCQNLVYLSKQHAHRVTVIGEEKRPAYDRVNLTEFFEGKSPKELSLAHPEWYQDNDIDLQLGDPAIEIDREKRRVETIGGKDFDYDTLILATGSRPYVPDFKGKDLEGVFVYRTIEDVEEIKAYAAQAESAAVIGGGLLGLEAAKALQDLGLRTHILEYSGRLMSRQLDLSASAVLQGKVEKLGVLVHNKATTEWIEAIDAGRRIYLTDGRTLTVDMVVISTGIRPRSELAKKCGLELGLHDAIIVNNRLQTSDKNIYAIGECAMHKGRVYGFVAPGYRMADILSQNLTGKRNQFSVMDFTVRLKLLGVDVCTIGENLGVGEVKKFTDQKQYRQLVLDRGRLIGGTFIGPCPEAALIQADVEKRRRLWNWKLKEFETAGSIWDTEFGGSVKSWPDASVICNCNHISKREILNCISKGCKTVEDVSNRTTAGSVCGSCRPLIAQLTGGEPAPAVRGGGILIGMSLAGLILALVTYFANPVEFSDTVQDVRHQIDAIWRESLYKQISGYTLLGVTCLGLFLSIRKRIKLFSFGAFMNWRILHTISGVLTLVILFAHTGFRMGHNLNYWLMLTFLSLNVLGALAGIVTGVESRGTGSMALLARKAKPYMTWMHIILFWPLPLMILFHILSVYFY